MAENAQSEVAPCPVQHAHRRLMDCHEQWHSAEQNYMEPEKFRLHLNSLIQNLRSVTWLLQKQKAQLPEFDVWYQKWRKSTSDDHVMKWLVAARNRIVKEADLELLSRADVKVSVDWLNEVRASWVMPPRYTTRHILVRLLSTRQIPAVGLMTIERRWIDNRLPDRELLEALAHVYQRITAVVATAHSKAGVTNCDFSLRPPCVTASLTASPLNCMQQWDDRRRLHINLTDRVEVAELTELMPYDSDIGALARERYGEITMTGDPITRVSAMPEVNKRMLVADKSLVTMTILFKDELVIDIFALDFYDQTSKRIAMDRVAERVGRFEANGAIFISEAWFAALEPGVEFRTSEVSSCGVGEGVQ